MNRITKFLGLATAACLTSTPLFGALIPGSSTATTKVYEDGAEKLTVYTDVPGHGISMINGYASRTKSDIYEIWVRSAASNNEWVQCFANMTYNRAAEMPELTGFGTATAKHAYQRHTAGWTHTYANIEMSDNSPVEVEIRKIGTTTLDGSASIVKSAVHPAHKIVPGSKRDENGRVYFKIDKPCQMVIDINGQMDDHNAAHASSVAGGRMPDGSPVHSIAFYANPIMAKPVAGPTNTLLTVDASQSTPTTRLTQPDPATYDTLAFGPGVHNIGPNFKVHPGKSYFIPGDAIVYGNIGNGGVPQGTYRSNGDRIKIYGYGTICGIQVPHYQNNTNNPQYPEWNAWTGVKDQGVGIEMSGAWDTTITGVTTIDPANFNTKFDGQLNRTNDQSLVSWVKLHSWRVNGDGFGGYAPVEDSFFRTSDDSTYVRDWRRRCTFWKDTNANLFRFVNYKAGGLDDCDIIYARWRDSRGVGSVFEFANGGFDQAEVLDLNLTIRDIRFHDKHSNPSHLFSMNILQSYRGLVFENISAYLPKNGNKSTLFGSATAPWYERLVFKNVTYKASAQSQYETGTLLTAANFNTYFDTNEFVKYTLFDHPRDLTLAITADPVRGFVTKTPNQATHVETTLATLTATPEPGYIFTNWVGLDPEDPTTVSTANPITIRMLDHRNLTANFDLADIANPVVITTPRSGSWVVPEGVYSATIQAWGGGGAGGSAQHTLGASNVSIRGGGGTGGSFSSKTLRVSPGQVINYQVGAGGVGSTLPSGQAFPADSNSGDGSSSSASVNGQNTLLAIGGLGGKNKSGTTSSSAGGGRTSPLTGNIGDLFYYGGNGAGSTSNGTGGGGGSAGAQGAGGNAPAAPAAGIAGLGGGAAGAAGHNGTIVGNAGGYPGGGGSGAAVRNSSAAYTLLAGGKGGDGKLVATYNTLNVDFNLTTQATPGGSVTPGGIYDAGTIVTLQATPLTGYRFTGWSGGLTGATNPATFTLADDTTVTANFVRQYSFTISAANGTVTLSPPGGIYDAGTEVTITATADANYRFAGWAGDLAGSTNPLVVVIASDLSVAGNFIQQVTLTTSATNGSITLSPPGGTYDVGTPVTVTAVANPDTQFVGWGGALSGTLNPQIITMDASKSVTADFNQQFSLVTQSVNGTISASVAGGTHNAGTPITLTATADENFRFTGWSGSLTGSNNPATIVMDANQVITANFIRIYQLTTAAVNGTVSPASGTFDEGSSVTLTATPALGFGFLEWNGDVAGPVNPVTVVMDGPKSVTANFRTKEAFSTPGSGTWVVPAGVYSLLVEAWGGGGSGGSAHHQPGATNVSVRGGGGAGGGYSRTTLQVRPGQEIHYTVAAGGAGSELGAEPNFPTGSRSGSGMASSAILNGIPFLSAVGGQGGVNMSGSTVSVGGGAGVAASSGSIGDVTRYGGDGGTSSSTGTGGGGGSAGFSTNGGHSSFFTGGLGGLGGGTTGANGHNITAAGVAGNPPGAGGSGGGVRNNSSPNAIRIGGKGGDGLISITQNPLNVTFTLEMQTSVGGSVSPGPSVMTYPAGTTVNISAVAADGYRFSGWSGSFTGTSPSAAVLLEENMTIKANFIPRFTLTTSAVNGTLTLNPPGGVYDADTVVTASIQADANHRFTGWSGAASGTASQVEVTMDGNKDLTALIVRQHTLTTSATNGTITVNPPGGTYDENAVIRLTATPDSGYTFSGWSDGSLGSSSTVDITMSALRDVTANFTSKGERVPWTVNFDGLANATTSQGLPASWTATRTGGGTFRVLTNRLAINGAGGEGVFTSGIMDISGGNVNLALSVVSQGNLESGNGSAQDYFRLYTRINGGAETLARQVLGNQSTTTWTASNLSGNTLQIIVRAKVTDSTEYYYLDNVSVVDVPLPSPWQTADIGAAAAPGLARVKASTWTILGSGQDIWGTADEFRYVYQTTSADCNVVAQVASMTNTNGLAKSGVMIRESTAAGSINAMVCATPDEGVVFQWRSATGGSTSSVKITGLATPKWLKIERVGNSFTAFHSNDNTTWNPIGTAVTLPMAASATTGMAVTSRNDGVLCTSTVSGAAAAP